MQALPYLAITIGFELIVVLLFFRWQLRDAAIFSILVNLITWPIGMYLYHHGQVNWYILEGSIVLVEAVAVYYYWNVTAAKALLIALVANTITAFLLPVLDFLGIALPL